MDTEGVVIDGLGWFGMVLILAAYLMLTTDRLSSRSRIYQGLNGFGSIFVGLNAVYRGALPSFALNAVWLLIAIYGLIALKPESSKGESQHLS